MAKYCPKCYAGIGPDDAVCGNCGNVLKENVGGEEDFTAGVFDNENLSHDVSEKEIPGETPDEEILSHEIVADEIIADGIVEEEIAVSETITTTPDPVKTPTQRQAVVENTEVPMTLGDWMLTLLLLYLPIVNIVMLIIWSVDSKTSTTKKHFAWATLIFMGIGIVLSIIFSSIVAAIVASMLNSMYYY
ncbi:MAG: zinc ribbon domain-containing protein [Acetobacterium sp.]|nr:zinc ribbon domain-containing protein [Bacillota bacterium]MCG2728806.1 zinc ribbon domain-containing protein [Acetobacterium sp.]